MIPTVLIAHALKSRSVRTVEVTHTAADGVNATKTAEPQVRDPRTVGDLTGLDVLVVDDIAGTGETIAMTRTLLRRAGAARVRTLACVVNTRNWYTARRDKPDETLTYIGMTVEGWVIFPWERQ
jgi:hypoxanthine phosphoribosyltransferase